LYELHAI
jgi:hypothetical protein